MIRKQRTNMLILLILLAFAAAGGACSFGKTNSQNPTGNETVRSKPAESPTPAYQPPKRLSRDVIKTDKKEEPVKIKTK